MTKTQTRPTSRYQDAILKKELLSDWYGNPTPALQGFMEFWRQSASSTNSARATMPDDISMPQILRGLKQRVDMSEMFYLTEDVSRILQSASEVMPPYLTKPEDFPSTHGMVWFEKPLEFNLGDGINDKVRVRAVTWSREEVGNPQQHRGPGMVTWNFQDTRDAKISWMGATSAQLSKVTAIFPVAYGATSDARIPWVSWGKDQAVANMRPALGNAFHDYYAARDGLSDYVPLPENATVLRDGTADGRWVVDIEGDVMSIEPDPISRFLQAFFAFLQQELPALERREVQLPKPMARRFRYKHMTDAPVTLIHWRKRERPPGSAESTGRTLSYRHPRRGHWRRNNRRKIDGQWTMYPIYIHPTIVGDASLPFRDREVVNVVNR